MADVLSKIRLEATGGDQVAREFGKIREAAESTSKAAEGFSVGGPQDPFQRAVAPGPGSDSTNRFFAERQERNSRERDRAEERQESVKRRRIETGGAQIIQGTATGATGDAVGGLGQIAGGIASMALGPAVVGAAAAFALIKGGAKILKDETEMINQLWSSGISQRLGADLVTLRNFRVEVEKTGIPTESLMGLLGGLGGAGYVMRTGYSAGELGPVTIGAEAISGMGADPGTVAAMIGAGQAWGLQEAGGVMGPQMYQRALGFGRRGTGDQAYYSRGSVNKYIATITEQMAARSVSGIRESDTSSKMVSQMGARLSAYRQVGMTETGAFTTFQLMQERGRSAAALQRPEDMIALQALMEDPDNEGKSITELRELMEREPGKVNSAVYKFLSTRYSGDRDLLVSMAQSYTGGSVGQTTGWLDTEEKLTTPGYKTTEAPWSKVVERGGGLGRALQAFQQRKWFNKLGSWAIRKTLGIDALQPNPSTGITYGSPVVESIGDPIDTTGANTVENLSKATGLSKEDINTYGKSLVGEDIWKAFLGRELDTSDPAAYLTGLMHESQALGGPGSVLNTEEMNALSSAITKALEVMGKALPEALDGLKTAAEVSAAKSELVVTAIQNLNRDLVESRVIDTSE